MLTKLLKGSHLSVVLNQVYEEEGAIVFHEACKLGCKGVVSKRLGSIYRGAGRRIGSRSKIRMRRRSSARLRRIGAADLPYKFAWVTN